MQIQQARINDHFHRIDDIIRTNYFQSPDEKRNSGFFNYYPSADYLVRLIEGGLCLVACDDKGEVQGFATAVDKETLRKARKFNSGKALDSVIKSDGELIYIDQLAVRNPGSLIGARAVILLANRLVKIADSRRAKLVCAIPETSWRNLASQGLVLKYGFQRTREVQEDSNITLGLWEKAPSNISS